MKRIITIFFICLLFGILLSGCGNKKSGDIVTGTYYYPAAEGAAEESGDIEKSASAEASGQISAVIGTDLYLIISNDMTTEHFILEQLASGRQYMYYYSLTTRFLDKYGDNTTVSYFEPGRIITIGAKDSEGKLKEVQISDQVWEYPDITRYSVDEDRGVFKIGDTNYSYGEALFVVSDGERIALSALKDGDEIRVIGMNKEILSVAVTTGNGTVELKNTEIFEGSYVQIGKKIFAEITGEMTVEVPEGTYLVTVANKGYGGSTEIEVGRNQTVTVDLDELKGEGPKKGKILFAIDVAGATLSIDGKSVDYSEALSLDYGIHSIAAYAAGYETYEKKLFVNSEEATILISLSDEASASDSESESSTDSSATASGTGTAGSLAGSIAGQTSQNTSAGTDSASAAATSDDTTTDYLSTLSELLSTIIN